MEHPRNEKEKNKKKKGKEGKADAHGCASGGRRCCGYGLWSWLAGSSSFFLCVFLLLFSSLLLCSYSGFRFCFCFQFMSPPSLFLFCLFFFLSILFSLASLSLFLSDFLSFLFSYVLIVPLSSQNNSPFIFLLVCKPPPHSFSL